MTQYLPGMWLAVDSIISVKGITVLLSLVGFQKKVLTLKSHEHICK